MAAAAGTRRVGRGAEPAPTALRALLPCLVLQLLLGHRQALSRSIHDAAAGATGPAGAAAALVVGGGNGRGPRLPSPDGVALDALAQAVALRRSRLVSEDPPGASYLHIVMLGDDGMALLHGRVCQLLGEQPVAGPPAATTEDFATCSSRGAAPIKATFLRLRCCYMDGHVADRLLGLVSEDDDDAFVGGADGGAAAYAVAFNCGMQLLHLGAAAPGQCMGDRVQYGQQLDGLLATVREALGTAPVAQALVTTAWPCVSKFPPALAAAAARWVGGDLEGVVAECLEDAAGRWLDTEEAVAYCRHATLLPEGVRDLNVDAAAAVRDISSRYGSGPGVAVEVRVADAFQATEAAGCDAAGAGGLVHPGVAPELLAGLLRELRCSVMGPAGVDGDCGGAAARLGRLGSKAGVQAR